MTEVIYRTNLSVFDPKFSPAILPGPSPVDSPSRRAYKKRLVTQRSCFRLAASGLPGTNLAIEYIYGKYIRNLATSTIRQSGSVLLYFLHFLEQEGTTVYTLTSQDIGKYIESEQGRGLTTQSIVSHLRILYAFIVFLVNQGVLQNTIIEHKIRIKLPDALPRAISPEDLQHLLEAIRSDRDRALILLLLRTGMRIGELLEVHIADISFAERKILIYLGEKNFQGRTVYYSEDAEQALKKWLTIRPSNSTYLFPGRSGLSSICHVAAWQALRKILDRAGLAGKGYCLHSLRHTFATDMINAGMRLEVLQQLLGHQEIEMTLRYARITDLTREHEYFKAMSRIEQGEHYEHCRVNTQLQKVFEEKKLLRSKRK